MLFLLQTSDVHLACSFWKKKTTLITEMYGWREVLGLVCISHNVDDSQQECGCGHVCRGSQATPFIFASASPWKSKYQSHNHGIRNTGHNLRPQKEKIFFSFHYIFLDARKRTLPNTMVFPLTFATDTSLIKAYPFGLCVWGPLRQWQLPHCFCAMMLLLMNDKYFSYDSRWQCRCWFVVFHRQFRATAPAHFFRCRRPR